MTPVWNFVLDHLRQDRKVILLVVVDSQGSSPGKQGFLMAVEEEAGSAGTIGGGVMEFNLVQHARNLLRDDKAGPELLLQVHHQNAPLEEQSGMICAGSQRVALVPLRVSDMESVQGIVRAAGSPGAGFWEITPEGLSFHPDRGSERAVMFTSGEEGWRYRESVGDVPTVYVVGGGHVGLAVSRVLATLDFHVVVFDHRSHLDTLDANVYAGEKIVGPYEELGDHVREGGNSYIVIVTTARPFDTEALYRVAAKQVRYIGLMGSKAKIKWVFEDLEKRGVSRDLLNRVHAPIGIDIGNRTPAEIGISVAAEIVRLRNEAEGGSRK